MFLLCICHHISGLLNFSLQFGVLEYSPTLYIFPIMRKGVALMSPQKIYAQKKEKEENSNTPSASFISWNYEGSWRLLHVSPFRDKSIHIYVINGKMVWKSCINLGTLGGKINPHSPGCMTGQQLRLITG